MFFVADDADMGIWFILSQSSSFCFPSSKVSATALMHSLTTPPSVNGFLCWPKIQVTLREHSLARCWAVNEWVRIRVDCSYWALRLLIFCDRSSDLSGWVCLVKNFVLCLIVAFHVATFYEYHCLWAHETDWCCVSSGKNEHEWVRPFWVESSVFALHFSLLRERHV